MCTCALTMFLWCDVTLGSSSCILGSTKSCELKHLHIYFWTTCRSGNDDVWNVDADRSDHIYKAKHIQFEIVCVYRTSCSRSSSVLLLIQTRKLDNTNYLWDRCHCKEAAYLTSLVPEIENHDPYTTFTRTTKQHVPPLCDWQGSRIHTWYSWPTVIKK